MTFEELVERNKKVVPIKYEDVEKRDNVEFEKIFIDQLSKIFARKTDVEILNKFAKLSDRKKYKIHKWLERTK